MNKPEMIAAVASTAKITKTQADAAVDALIGTIGLELLENGRCRVDGLGIFEVVRRAPKAGRNPRTGEPVSIPERQVVTFRPSPDIKEAAAAAKRVA